MTEAKRLDKLDNVKWILTLLIVLYHIGYQEQNEIYRSVFMFVKNSGDCVVPAFSLISGFLFFSYVKNFDNIKRKMRRRILTLLVPYLSWNLVNTIFVKSMNTRTITAEIFEINLYTDLAQWNSSPHFWYIFMLIFWTALAPVLFIAYKDKRILFILALSQLIYIIYVNDNILHSRFVYILYTWGGYIGYRMPELFTQIEDWDSKIKIRVCIVSGVFYFGIYMVYSIFEVGMQFKVWLYALRAVMFILATINLPLLRVGKFTGFRYSFWIFAVHYWLDYYVSGLVFRLYVPVLVYQVMTWMIVVVLGLLSGFIIDKVCPKCFSVLTGNRSSLE